MDPHVKTLCAILSVFLSTIAFIPYVIEAWKIKSSGDVRPTVSGWASWMLSDAVILAAMVASNAISWQMVPYIMGPMTVICLSLRKGIKIAHMRGESASWKAAFMDWGHKDTVCMLLVVGAIVVWGINHNPDHAIFLTLCSTIIGTWAIARHLRKDPYREPLVPWILCLVGGMFGVVAVPVWNFAGAAAPILFVGVQSTMVGLCLRRFQSRFRLASR